MIWSKKSVLNERDCDPSASHCNVLAYYYQAMWKMHTFISDPLYHSLCLTPFNFSRHEALCLASRSAQNAFIILCKKLMMKITNTSLLLLPLLTTMIRYTRSHAFVCNFAMSLSIIYLMSRKHLNVWPRWPRMKAKFFHPLFVCMCVPSKWMVQHFKSSFA